MTISSQLAAARPTTPSASAWIGVGVLVGVFMSIAAVGDVVPSRPLDFSRRLPRLTPLCVDCNCDGFKMFGVDAQDVAAQVVEFKSIRDRADQKLIGKSVCCDDFPRSSGSCLKLPIASVRKATFPAPTMAAVVNTATVLVDLEPESFFRRLDFPFVFSGWHVMNIPALV